MLGKLILQYSSQLGKAVFCFHVLTVTHEEAAGFYLPWAVGLSLGNINPDVLFVNPKTVPTRETKIHIP